jgi:hypothetical protein
MSYLDSLMAGAQVNPELGASLQAMPDQQRLAMLQRLGIQPGSPAAQVTGNWTDSLNQPPPMPGVPRRPSSPIPAGPGTPPMPTATQGVPMPTSSAGGGSTPPPMPSSAAAAAMPTGPGGPNPVVTPGQAGPPMPARNPMLTDVTGGTAPPFLGSGQAPMAQAPSGAPVPASSPLAIAGPQSAAQATGGNAGPMLAGLPGAAPAFMQPTPGATPLSAPGAIPAQLRALLTDPQTGRLESQNALINRTVGINPTVGFNGIVPDWLQPSAQLYQRGVGEALGAHAQGIAALNAAENAGTARGDLGLRSLQQLGGNGVPGQMQLAAQEQSNRNQTVADALGRGQQRARHISAGLAQYQQVNGQPAPPDVEQQIVDQAWRTYPDLSSPQSAAPGSGAPTPAGPPALPPAAPGNPSARPNAPHGAPTIPGAEAQAVNPMLRGVQSHVRTQYFEPTGGTVQSGPSRGQPEMRPPTNEARLMAAITDYISRARAVPTVPFQDAHNSAGTLFGPAAMTRWLQQNRTGSVLGTGGMDPYARSVLEQHLADLAANGQSISDTGTNILGIGLPRWLAAPNEWGAGILGGGGQGPAGVQSPFLRLW